MMMRIVKLLGISLLGAAVTLILMTVMCGLIIPHMSYIEVWQGYIGLALTFTIGSAVTVLIDRKLRRG